MVRRRRRRVIRRVPVYVPYPVEPKVIKVEVPSAAIPTWVAPVAIIGIFGIILAIVATKK